MNTHARWCLTAAMLALLPAPALAQGKIDDVDRHAREGGGQPSDNSGGGGGDCSFLCSLVSGILHSAGSASGHKADSVEPATQTYGRFPWGGPRRDQVFVTRGPEYRPHFGVASVSYFRDAASTLEGASIDIEGGFQEGYLAFNTTAYGEETPQSSRTMWTMRGEIGGVGRMGRGFFTGGVGGRVACLDTDVCAGGFDFSVGGRVLPARPLVLAGNARLGFMKWHEGSWFLATEYNASAAVALGRFEIGAGWHWLKLGSANAFGGPTLVTRVWF